MTDVNVASLFVIMITAGVALYSRRFSPDLFIYVCLSADFRRYKRLQRPDNRLLSAADVWRSVSTTSNTPRLRVPMCT